MKKPVDTILKETIDLHDGYASPSGEESIKEKPLNDGMSELVETLNKFIAMANEDLAFSNMESKILSSSLSGLLVKYNIPFSNLAPELGLASFCALYFMTRKNILFPKKEKKVEKNAEPNKEN